MKINMGGADRIIRAIIAAIIGILFFTKIITGTLAIILLVVAVIFLLTSLISFCPIYWPFGMSTCSSKKEGWSNTASLFFVCCAGIGFLLENLVYFILLALLAEILGTVGGFGSSLFFVPIASYFLDFHSVLGITAIFHLSSNITKIAFFRRGFDKKLILQIGIPAVFFVVVGAYISKYINSSLLEMILAVFLILTSLTLLVFKKIVLKPTIKNSIGGGTLSGLIAGLLGTGGAIRGITLAAFNLRTEVFIATSAIIDLGIDFSRSVVYSLNGYVHQHDLYLIPFLFVVSILGTFIGKQILKRVSEKRFKSFVLILVLITGLITFGKVIF